jgi:hypothetical protein
MVICQLEQLLLVDVAVVEEGVVTALVIDVECLKDVVDVKGLLKVVVHSAKGDTSFPPDPLFSSNDDKTYF